MLLKDWFQEERVGLFANFVIFVGLIILLTGLGQKFGTKQGESSFSVLYPSTLKERELAQKSALQQGKKEYRFETNFLPGIGYVGDGKSLQQQNTDRLLQQKNLNTKF